MDTLQNFAAGLGAGKILIGCIVFFSVLSIYLFKRIPGGALWNHRKNMAKYQQHLKQIDDVLARAQVLSKQKEVDQNKITEQKAQLAAEINDILKKSPLSEVSKASESVAKLAGKPALPTSKIDGRYRAPK